MPIAQINIARMLAPLESETMKEFRDFLDPVNALAESSPGFIWRFVEDEHPQDKPFDHWPDDMLIVNMSVWESLDELKQFVYHTVHAYFVKSRKRWFEQMDRPHTVLWVVPEGHLPTLAEAKAKLELLEAEGPSAEAFLFAQARLFHSQ